MASDMLKLYKISRHEMSGHNPGYVCREVMIKFVWVLECAYKYLGDEVSGALLSLVSASDLVVETADDVAAIVILYQNEGFGFSDHMLRQAALHSGAKVLKTFDQKLSNLSGVELLGATH
tara:strand:+ start:471 stop:830 length:360 start_codon:yes stop_codon:yes gene_type:complete